MRAVAAEICRPRGLEWAESGERRLRIAAFGFQYSNSNAAARLGMWLDIGTEGILRSDVEEPALRRA